MKLNKIECKFNMKPFSSRRYCGTNIALSLKREGKVAWKHQVVELGLLFDAVQLATASFFWR